jgi:hypothetical protein
MVATKAFIDTGSVAGALAATISLPDEYEPMRISSNYRTTPVALAKAFEESKYNWSQAQPNGVLPATDALIFLFRNAANHWIRYVGAAPGPFGYFWRWDLLNIANPEWFPITGPLGHYELEPQLAIPNPSDAYHPHGEILPAGVDEGHHYMWVDSCAAALAVIQVNLTNAPAAGPPADEGNIKLMLWANGKRSIAAILPFVVGQNGYTFNPAIAGYYSIVIDHTAGLTDLATATVTQVGSIGCPVFEHHTLAGFIDNAARVQRYAITASALLWRNTASFENAQGDMGGVQVGSGLSWQDVANYGSYSAIAAAFPNGFESRFGAKGQYGYLKPEDEEDIEFKCSADISGDVITNMYFPLIADAPFLVYLASVAPTAGRETSLRICSHVQYQTNDSWADVQNSDNLVDSWNEASKILNVLPQFYDNAAHKPSLLSRIANAGKGAMKAVEKIISSPALGKIPVVAEGAGLIRKLTVPILKRGFQLMGDYADGNFKGATYEDAKSAIQQLDPRRGFDAYKMG